MTLWKGLPAYGGLFFYHITMKTKAQYHIAIITLGCSKNQVDSEFLAGKLKTHGIKVSHEYHQDETQAVIINTCGFINDAKEESIQTILEFLEAKKEGVIQQVFAMGCLTERYREQLKEEMLDLDGIFGVHEMEEVFMAITGLLKTELVGERMLTTPKHYAYLKVSEGCDRSCAFCAIPNIRGKNISRTIASLTEEAIQLSESGVKELILIAQDLTYYGIDLYGERKLADLLKELVKISGIEWIRLHYTFPTGFPEDVLTLMRDEEKICKYIDIPFQHINSVLLKSMRRGIDREKTLQLIHKMRTMVPGVALRTTLIAGYPGETSEQFEELMDFVREMKFERLGVFPYSHEEDTPAYLLPDDVAEEEKYRRVDEVMALQQDISLMHNQAKVGQQMKVIVDREDEEFYYGRTAYDSPEVDNEILLEKSRQLSQGDFVMVEITGAEDFDLYGKVLA